LLIMSSTAQEPSLTFHSEERSLIPSLHVPNIEAMAAGAHFNATADKQLDHGDHLNRVPSRLDTDNIKLEEKRRQVVGDVLECYCCRPTKEIFHRSWHPDAVFEGAAVKCYGYREYAAQFYAMRKAFSKARTLNARVLLSTHGPIPEQNRLVYEQEQEYTFRYIGTELRVTSVITLDLDDNDNIIHLTDKWSGKDFTTGFIDYLRRFSAKSLPWLVSVPKY